jgi:large subunit ribosomal protein L29
MKASDLRDLPYDKLAERLAEAKEELFNLRFQLATRQLDNPMRIREVKKDIARVKTIQRERELRGERVGG